MESRCNISFLSYIQKCLRKQCSLSSSNIRGPALFISPTKEKLIHLLIHLFIQQYSWMSTIYINVRHWDRSKTQSDLKRSQDLIRMGEEQTLQYNAEQGQRHDTMYIHISAEEGEGCSVKRNKEGIEGSLNIDLDSETWRRVFQSVGKKKVTNFWVWLASLGVAGSLE